MSPYQCTFSVLEVRHHDFRDRLPDVYPNDVVQLQATTQVAHDSRIRAARSPNVPQHSVLQVLPWRQHRGALPREVYGTRADGRQSISGGQRRIMKHFRLCPRAKSRHHHLCDVDDAEDADTVEINNLFSG